MKYIKTRLFSLLTLSGIIAGCGALGREGYFAATDSFVAPAILSPDNDLVLEQKIKLEQILLEKGHAESILEEANSDLEAGDKAITRLNALKDMAKNALVWTKATTNQQVQAGTKDIQALDNQKDQLVQMMTNQSNITLEAKKNMEGGLIQEPDYLKEVQALNQIQIAIFENDRSRMQSELLLGQANMGQQSLHGSNGAMPTPEQVMSADQLVRIECQLLQTEADMRSKSVEKSHALEELQKIAVLEDELRARPLFKAIESNIDIAFVPYTGLKDIKRGSRLMDCVWGVFNCREVGTVANVIPGETILPDIFGSGQVRGQFITLNLNRADHDNSMQSKVLRVRNDIAVSNNNRNAIVNRN